MPTKVEISYKTIIFTIAFVGLLWFLFQIREIIFWVFISLILMSAFKPWAESLERFRVPRAISILIMYVLIIAVLAGIATLLIPPFVIQTVHLIESLPGYISHVMPFATIDVQTATQQITPIGENLVKISVGVFNNVIGLFTIFVIAFYLTMERRLLSEHLARFMGEEASKPIIQVISKMEERMGAWVRGQLILAITIGLFTYFGLYLLKIPYALPLALLAGLLEIVPIIGPIIASIPAIIIGLTISPFLALATTAFYIILQQLEANLVVPVVMRRAIGMPPLVTIIAIMAGAQVGGISGALIAIPIVVIVETALSEYLKLRGAKQK